MKWRLDSVLEETLSVSDSCGTGYMKLQIGHSWIRYVIIDPFILGFFFKKNFFIKFFKFFFIINLNNFFFNFFFIFNFLFFFFFFFNFLVMAMDFLDLLKRILEVGFGCEEVG